MGQPQTAKFSLRQLLRRFLSYCSWDWIAAILDLVRGLHRAWSHGRQEGMYEILDYDATIELLDPKGERAVFHKRQRVKFLQDHILIFQDYAWGEGNLFATYRCSPGVVVDRYQEGDRWNVLISLRSSKSRGDIEEFTIERKVKGGFTKDDEWRQVEIRHRTRRLRLAVVFPKTRPCRQAQLIQRSRHRALPLGPEHFHALPDGRQRLAWEAKNVQPLEIYTLRWRW
jgi:hypothetical protein